MLIIFSSTPFYSAYVHAPSGRVAPSKIRNSPKYWPYFKDTIGAMDGSHIVAAPLSYPELYLNPQGIPESSLSTPKY